MISIAHKFLRLLALEVESMHDELDMLVASLDDRLARAEISDYVRNENFVVLRNEVLGLEDCLRGIGPLEGCEVESLDDAVALARRTLHDRIRAHGYVPAVGRLIDSRLDKIVRYLEDVDPGTTPGPIRGLGGSWAARRAAGGS